MIRARLILCGQKLLWYEKATYFARMKLVFAQCWHGEMGTGMCVVEKRTGKEGEEVGPSGTEQKPTLYKCYTIRFLK